MSLDLVKQSPAHWLAQLKCRYLVDKDLPALEWDGEYSHFRRLYRDIYQSTLQGKAIMWVATLAGDEVIGQLFVQLASSRTELANGKTRAYIYGFRVKSPYRGNGVGANLLSFAEDDLATRGFRLVSLNVGRDNPDARRFYERHGYRVVGNEAGCWFYVDDQDQRREVNEPAWRMQKQLR
jgi:ribosomal protein S18 acetylase RimI-like enzyme